MFPQKGKGLYQESEARANTASKKINFRKANILFEYEIALHVRFAPSYFECWSETCLLNRSGWKMMPKCNDGKVKIYTPNEIFVDLKFVKFIRIWW